MSRKGRLPPPRRGAEWRQISEELDELTGLPPVEIGKLKRNAVKRMAIIDVAPREWRDLVNEFDPDVVADMAGKGFGAGQVRRLLSQRV